MRKTQFCVGIFEHAGRKYLMRSCYVPGDGKHAHFPPPYNQSHENKQILNKWSKPGPSGSIVTPSLWKQFVYFGWGSTHAVRLPQILIRASITASCASENRSLNKRNISPLFLCKKRNSKLQRASVWKNTNKTSLRFGTMGGGPRDSDKKSGSSTKQAYKEWH